MAGTRIVTDSTSCLPPELVEEYGITVVPVGLVIDGKLHRDCIDITLEEMCRRIVTMDQQPTTSAVSPGEFVTAFNHLAESADGVVCILVSRALTATQESAYLARRMVRSQHPGLDIRVIDSRTSAGALGFIVLEAARAAAAGRPLEEVVAVTRDMVSRVYYLAALDTLRYLINTGRAPRSGGVGEMLGVKPVIGFVDDTGMTEVVARVRGRRRSLARVAELVGRYVDGGQPIHLMVHYSDGSDDAEELAALVGERYPCVERYLTPYSPVMVGATGPMVGISFYQ